MLSALVQVHHAMLPVCLHDTNERLRICIMTMDNTNSHAVVVRPASYGHGTILASAADEARKSTQGRRMIRERILALGKDSIYNLTGLVRTFPLQPQDLGPWRISSPTIPTFSVAPKSWRCTIRVPTRARAAPSCATASAQPCWPSCWVPSSPGTVSSPSWPRDACTLRCNRPPR